MKYTLADDARPQVKLLLAATAATFALWFIPFAEYLVYPVRLFVTFLHEGSHALIALLTGGSVHSLTIGADGSGVVYSVPSGWLGTIATSSAGYLGTAAFGVLMLYLIRRSVSPNKVLFASGLFVGAMTLVFGVVSPLFNLLSLEVGLSSLAFTIFAGAVITAMLLGIAIYGSQRVASFAVAFLSVQCLLNALSDLKTLFFINAPFVGSSIQSDAGNMEGATGIPAVLWVVLWIGISLALIVVGLRLYAVRRGKKADTLFED